MEELGHDLPTRTDENQARDRAIMAFLNLGEKLRALASRGGGDQRRNFEAADALGASALFETIEGEIIPRLMLAHKGAGEAALDEAARQDALSEQDREAFLNCVLNASGSSARRFADELLRRGVSREDLFLDLLPSCARQLGDMWDKDLCDFTDVTIGLCRLHEVVRSNSASASYAPHRRSGKGGRILLATACGDQHVLGVVIVAEYFRSAGWRVTSEPGASQEHLAEILKEREYDVLALSAACSVFEEHIADEIRALRAASSNKDLKILVGGRLFSETPNLVEKVGADAFVGDPKLAAEVGNKLLAAGSAHC